MPLRILIVDDDFINRKLLQTLLRKNLDAIDIQEAENGLEALEKLKKDSNINLILLDIMMPILDGVDFLKIFRLDIENLYMPIIVLSTDDTRKLEVLNCGANDFLRKPVKENNLLDKIYQWTQQNI